MYFKVFYLFIKVFKFCYKKKLRQFFNLKLNKILEIYIPYITSLLDLCQKHIL